jgi:hypothetical protein
MKTLVTIFIFSLCCDTMMAGCFDQPKYVTPMVAQPIQTVNVVQPVVVQRIEVLPVVTSRIEYRPVGSYYLNYGHYYYVQPQYVPNYGYRYVADPWQGYNY